VEPEELDPNRFFDQLGLGGRGSRSAAGGAKRRRRSGDDHNDPDPQQYTLLPPKLSFAAPNAKRVRQRGD
jgi:hypothetical protein